MSNTTSGIEELPVDLGGDYAFTEEDEFLSEEEQEVYYSEDFISSAYLSENCTVPDNILKFEYPFQNVCTFFNKVTLKELKKMILTT